MAMEDDEPLLLRIKERRGLIAYDSERIARMTEDPPPQPEGRKIEEVPLFMRKKLPVNFPDNSHIPMYGKKEIFKGTQNEVALEFKNKGNEFFRARKWWDAREAYSDALEFNPSDLKLKEVLWLNIAAANIELQYWPGVLNPAARAITLNLKSTKAYYRAARALIHYERYEEALDCCKRLLAFDPYNEAILELMDDPNLGGNVSKQAKTEAARQALEKVYKVSTSYHLTMHVTHRFDRTTGSSYFKPSLSSLTPATFPISTQSYPKSGMIPTCTLQ
ncbi:CNS1 protein [Rhizoctonia solani AG-3 Rhs1AP]|uniref:CNS1 protein n=2 Tax=Rhizoctonia solani AG-3 TaxID=1086053 RepID=A0A074S8P8_9AGAM|nr:CNS1 protein [Rhizoctonia solani AG-3 Rhs1AP]KEP53995.1 CNS1 protein [Rhizoctonia solani 123E]